MPTELDRLIAVTEVNLQGLMQGFERAEGLAKAHQAKMRELLVTPTSAGSSTAVAAPIRALNAELKEAEAIQKRIAAQFSGSALPGATQSIAAHQRAVNAELREAEAIQKRLAAQYSTTALPVATSSLAQHKKELEEAAGASERYAQSWIKQGSQLQSLGTSLTMGVTAPIALIGTTAVRAALGFDQIIAKMTTLAGVSPQMANQFREQILAMAVATGQKPTDLAEAAYRIGSSGIQDKSQIPVVLQSVAQGSAIGLGDSTTVAETVTSAMNAYSQAGLTAAQATATLAAAVREGKGEASEFAPVIGRVGAMANEWGISFAQSAAGVAALTRLGLSADEAATAMRRMFMDLASPKGQQANALKALQIDANQLRETLKGPQGVLDALDLIRSKGGTSPEMIRSLFPDVRGMVGAMSLGGSHMDSARQAFGAVTAATPQDLSQAFQFTSLQPFFATKQAAAEFSTAMIRLGHEILPLVSSEMKILAGVLEGGSKWFSGMSEGGKTATTALLELAAAAGPLAFLTGSIEKLGGQILRLGPAIISAGAALAANPLLAAAILGTAAVGVLGYEAYQNMRAPTGPEMVTSTLRAGNMAGGESALGKLDETQRVQALLQSKLTAGGPAAVNEVLAGLTQQYAGFKPETQKLIDDTRKWIATQTGGGVNLGQEVNLSGMGPKPTIPPPPSGIHIPDAKERAAAEKAARQESSYELQADRAERGVAKSIAGITGDTDALKQIGLLEISKDEQEAIRRAGGKPELIDDAHREAAAKRIALDLQSTDAFISAKQKEEQAVQRGSQLQLQAINVQERAETGLLDVQLSSTRRQIQIDEQRGAPISRILSLYQQEQELIQRKATAEQSAAARSIPVLQEELKANQQYVEQLKQKRDALLSDPATGTQGAANKAEAYHIDQRITEETGRQLSITERLNAAQQTGLRIQEQTAADMERIEQERRRLNPTFNEAIRDRVGQSQYGANKEYADIAIDGIHSIGHALTDMLNKGKLDWQSLGNVARDVLTRIENKMLDRAIDQGIDWIMGRPGQGGTQQGGAAPQQAASTIGTSGGLWNWLYGGGSASAPQTAPTTTAGVQAPGSGVMLPGWNLDANGVAQAPTTNSLVSLFGGNGGAMGILPGDQGPFGPGGSMMPGGNMWMLMQMASLAAGGKKGLPMGIAGMMLPLLMKGMGGPGGIFGAAGSIFGGVGGAAGAGGLMGGLESILMQGAGGLGTLAGGVMGTLDNILGLGGATGAWAATGGGGGLLGMLGGAGGGLMSMLGGAGGGLMSLLGGAGSGIMSFLPFLFLHEGGLISHHTGTLASDEHLAKLQTGEMVLSRNDTAALFSGSSVRAPGGYRPDSRIFMANVSQANNRGGNVSGGGGGGVHVHHWHISTPDPHAFGAAQSEIQRQGATAMQRANRRNN